MKEFLDKIYFPYKSLRKGQFEFLKKVFENISQRRNIMVSAPTGLGKTISAIAPAISIAKKNDLTVVCLTSRQTQANQIIKTIREISIKSKEKISYVAFIGKRSMCAHQDKDFYPPNDFNEFCKKMRTSGKCEYYKNSQNKNYEEKINKIIERSSNSFMSIEEFIKLASSSTIVNSKGVVGFCPYEVAGKKAYKTDVVICDFNYIFSGNIRENFLSKIGRSLDECILIVDEAHNLPDRIRNSNSLSLSTDLIKNASKELNEFVKTSKYDFYISNLRFALNDLYHENLLGEKTEYITPREEFIKLYLSKFEKTLSGEKITIERIVDDLLYIDEIVKKEKIVSYIGKVAKFLDAYTNVDTESYLFVLEKQIKAENTTLYLKIKCIDPSDVSSKLVNQTFSTVMMSATLSPITMYRDILGVNNCEMLELDSPFARERQLTLVVDDVTTKYTSRTDVMFKKIAKKIEVILNAMENKNGIIFFPSYNLMDKILGNLDIVNLNRKVLREKRYMKKEEKENFVEEFKTTYSTKAKVLFAVTSGSFAEGLDLPNEALELVVVVGLPLPVPSLYIKEVIKYFDKKFSKGQLYGYIYPAIGKIIQAAGRCIRTENDKGVIILMDNRFLWPIYSSIFPKYWSLIRTRNPEREIEEFYSK